MTGGSTPGASEPSDPAAIVLDLFAQLHEQLRRELAGLDDDAVNWCPAPDANSIATIVTHMLGSEAETIRSVAGETVVRHRDEEFAGSWRATTALLDELGTADELIVRVRPEISAERLGRSLALPTLPPDDRRSALAWMVANYGHAREHLGHIQLTRQLVLARPSDGGGAERGDVVR